MAVGNRIIVLFGDNYSEKIIRKGKQFDCNLNTINV